MPRVPTEYDIVIRNGRVLDGAGNPWILADVAIANGRFAEVGRVEAKVASRSTRAEIRLARLIDVMDQSGSVLPRSGLPRTSFAWG